MTKMPASEKSNATGPPPKSHSATRNGTAWAGFLQGSLLILLVLAVYWPVLSGQFVWDDPLVVQQNPLVKGEASLGSIWFQGDFPLSTAVFWLQWLLWGNNPAGYHVVNVLLHGLGAVLVWRALARLAVPGAWLGAAVFALHPVCVASAGWISELKNTLSLPFYLLSIEFYLRADDARAQANTAKAGLWYGLALSAFVLGLFGKTSTVMLPVVLLGCVWWRRGRLTGGDVLLAGPFFALAIGFGLMTVWFQAHQAIKDAVVQTESLAGRLAAAGMAVWFYLGKAFVPVQLNLIYPRWEINAAEPLAYVPLAMLAAVLAACWWFRRNWGRPVLFALGFFTVNLLPVLGLVDMYYLAISRVSDHFQYISLIGPAAVLGALLNAASQLRLLRWVGPAVLMALAGLTMARAHIFATEERLWTDTLSKNPAAWPAHNNLGCIRAEQGRLAEAIKHFETSLRLKPDNLKAHINLGRALAEQSRFANAEMHFRTALGLSPTDADAHKFYGIALANQGRTAEAILHLREALRSRAELDTFFQLGDLLWQTGQIAAAIKLCRRAVDLFPNTPEALNNLAWLLATAPDDSLRNGVEAVQLAERACALSGFKNASMVGTLAAAYARSGRFDEAIATAQKAIDLARAAADPRLAEANERLLELYRAGKPYHEPERLQIEQNNQ